MMGSCSVSFYEKVAEALDERGIESRIHDEVLLIPIASDVELSIESVALSENVENTLVNKITPAHVFVSRPLDSDEEEVFSSAFVGVVFSVDSAVETVNRFMATEQVVSIMSALIEGTDERLNDMPFRQDIRDPLTLRADVGDSSEICVEIEAGESTPVIKVIFSTTPVEAVEQLENTVEDIVRTLPAQPTEEEIARIYEETECHMGAEWVESIDVGVVDNFDELCDLLVVAQYMADTWEELLDPLESWDM